MQSIRLREIERLNAENRALNEQVKGLVRAERKVALSQQSLDRQLHFMRILNRFALAAGQAKSKEDILRLAIDSLLSMFPYEQALGFIRNEYGTYDLAIARAVDGMGTPELDRTVTLTREAAAADWPTVPLIGEQKDLCQKHACIRPFVETLDRVFVDACGGASQGDPALLALPVFLGEPDPRGLIVLRRLTPTIWLLEHLPTEAEIPFLNLVLAHATISMQNLLSLGNAQEAIRLRDEFLSIASHELKTPLTSLLLQLQSFIRKSGLAESLVGGLRTMEGQCKRLASLVEQLLDVSRIRVGRLAPHFTNVDFGRLVHEVLSRFSEELLRTGSTVSVQCPEAVTIHGDPSQLEQVVTNLVSNAIKFGQGNPIEVRVESLPDKIRMEVIDHGIGIAAEDQARVFDRFERAVSSQYFGGLGLGLYITRQIIEAHGGSVAVRSAFGKGAVFTLELPRRVSTSA